MSRLGIPVPPGFTVTTEVCTYYYANNASYPPELNNEVDAALGVMAETIGTTYGDPDNPLLVSVRSGARQSMPGMMETVLNVGLTSETLPGLIRKTGNARFVYDAYRRLITMYSDVVMEKAEGIEPADGEGIRERLEELLEEAKQTHGVEHDSDLTAEQLEALCDAYRQRVEEVLGRPFPDRAEDQLWGAIGAVFRSWNGKRAKKYRRIEGIPDAWGTAVTVQAMVFGNMGENSATGVAFTRNPATGELQFYGEWLPNAQGEDVVAGIRTPYALNDSCRTDTNAHLPTFEDELPQCYDQLRDIRRRLEGHYRDMQDIEFTVQEGRLWMLQNPHRQAQRHRRPAHRLRHGGRRAHRHPGSGGQSAAVAARRVAAPDDRSAGGGQPLSLGPRPAGRSRWRLRPLGAQSGQGGGLGGRRRAGGAGAQRYQPRGRSWHARCPGPSSPTKAV